MRACDAREGNHSKCQKVCQLIPSMAQVLDFLCALNVGKSQTNCFAGIQSAPISIVDYLRRIHFFSGCSDECFVVGLIYIDRLLVRQPHIVLNALTVHRLIITALLLAAKFYDDNVFNNKYFASIGGLATPELNMLECEFIFGISFNLVVELNKAEDSFFEYIGRLSGHEVVLVPQPQQPQQIQQTQQIQHTKPQPAQRRRQHNNKHHEARKAMLIYEEPPAFAGNRQLFPVCG